MVHPEHTYIYVGLGHLLRTHHTGFFIRTHQGKIWGKFLLALSFKGEFNLAWQTHGQDNPWRRAWRPVSARPPHFTGNRVTKVSFQGIPSHTAPPLTRKSASSLSSCKGSSLLAGVRGFYFVPETRKRQGGFRSCRRGKVWSGWSNLVRPWLAWEQEV